MNELVKDLRTASEGWKNIPDIAPESWHGELMAKAADEIERLRAALQRIVDELDSDVLHHPMRPAHIARAALNGEKE